MRRSYTFRMRRLELSERTYTYEASGAVKPRDKKSAAVMLTRAAFDPVVPAAPSPVLKPSMGIRQSDHECPGFSREEDSR